MINLDHEYIEINYEVVLQNLSALYKFVGGNTCGVIKSHSGRSALETQENDLKLFQHGKLKRL